MILKPVGLLRSPSGQLVPAYDPLWDYVEVLLPFCEAAGETPIEYAKEYAVTIGGAAAISGNQSKFYSSALATGLDDVANDDYVAVQLVQRLVTASVPFTVEWWARPNALPTTHGMMYQGSLVSNNNRIQFGRNTFAQVYVQGTSSTLGMWSNTDAVANVWTHWAIVLRSDNILKFYRDGVLQDSGTLPFGGGLTTSDELRWLYVGIHRTSSAIWSFNGYFNDFRLTMAERYSGESFTPPSALMVAS